MSHRPKIAKIISGLNNRVLKSRTALTISAILTIGLFVNGIDACRVTLNSIVIRAYFSNALTDAVDTHSKTNVLFLLQLELLE